MYAFYNSRSNILSAVYPSFFFCVHSSSISSIFPIDINLENKVCFLHTSNSMVSRKITIFLETIEFEDSKPKPVAFMSAVSTLESF